MLNKRNSLAYRYQYRPKFFNWLPVFLEKAQTTGTNLNLFIRCRYFSCYLFVSLWLCSHMSLSYLSSDDDLIFFCFAFCGALGLLSGLNSKKQKGSDSLPSLMRISPTWCTSLSEFLGEWLEVWIKGFIEDDAINGRFININSHYCKSVK